MSPGTERFYITGGTLPSHAASYIVRQADKDLYQGLCEGEFCYVLNTRQIGKSSLMVRCAQQLRAEGHRVALLDLTAIGQNVTIEEWYDGLLTLVAEQLGLRDELEDFWLAHERLGPMQRWIEAIRRVALEQREQRLFLFVDEIDCVRSLPFATDEFFVAIRECYNRRVQDPVFERLTFCLLGVATPADLITDTRLSPFNIGRRIVLTDFTFEEGLPLAQGLETSPPGETASQSSRSTSSCSSTETPPSPSESATRLLKQVFDWTHGHPYLTQRLCHALAQMPHPLQARDVDHACRELFLHPQAQNTDDNLAFVRNCLLRNEAEASALLDLYQRVRLGAKVKEEMTDPVHRQLRLSGIVRAERGMLQVRNKIYAQAFDTAWLDANIPDAEMRRQRLAYKRGIARAATFFAGLIALAAIVLGTVIVQTSRRDAAHLLYIADMNLIQREWEGGNITHVLELMAETQHSPDRNLEWDYWNRKCHQSIRTFALPERTYATAFSPDGECIASVTEQGTMQIKEVMSGKERLRIPIGHTPCRGLSYSPDGAALAIGVVESIQIRNAVTGRLMRTLPMSGKYIATVIYSEDGRFLASQDLGGKVIVWEVAQARKRFEWQDSANPIRAYTLYKDQIVTAQQNGLVLFRALESGKIVRRLQTSLASAAIVLSHDGTLLAGADRRGNVQIIQISTGEATFHAGHDGSLFALAFSSNDSRLIASYTLALNIWDMRSGRLLSTFKEHTDHAPGMAVSRDDRYVATGGQDHHIKVWDLRLPTDPLIVPVSSQALWRVLYSRDGTKLLACSSDGYATTWDAGTGQKLRSLHASTQRLTCAVFSHDGNYIVTADVLGAVKLWDFASGRPIRDFVGHTQSVNDVVFSPDDRQIFTASDDRTAIQWEVATGKLLYHFPAFGNSAEAIALSGEGDRLLVGSDDKTAILWDVQTKRQIRKFNSPAEVWSVAFSPDGRSIAISNLNNTAVIWDAETGRQLYTLRGHTGFLLSIVFSPDGKRIATSSRDETAKIWETQTGRELLTLSGHELQVSGVAFAPKEPRLATVGQDGTLRLWDATPLPSP